MRSFLLACFAVFSMGNGAVHEDMSIRTWVIPLTGIDLKTDTYVRKALSTAPSGFSYDKVVGVKTVVYSDPKPNNRGAEVFNFVRLSGIIPNTTRTNSESSNRSGGWYNVFAYSPGLTDRVYIDLMRVSGEDFFSANNYPWLSTNLRTFTDRAQKRGSAKLEYVCTSCPAPSTNVIWRKIGPWSMEKQLNNRSTQIDLSSYGIPSLNIVDMTAAIHSDPLAGTSNAILVADLEHTGRRPGVGMDGPAFLRGGILWYGYGCKKASAHGGKDCDGDFGAETYRLHMYGGPTIKPGGSGEAWSTYSDGGYRLPTGVGDQKIPVRYVNDIQNRGWVRIEYTGTKSSVEVPYAVKTKAMDIGTWNMSESPFMKEIRFATFGIAANRVLRLTTVIRSDWSPAGYAYHNFHSPRWASRGNEQEDVFQYAGGNTFIDESKKFIDGTNGVIGLSLTSRDSKFADPNGHHIESDNRGSVLVDYLMGSCEQGPSGFKIQGIPGTQAGDCAGNASTFALEGGGADIWGNTDEFTFVSKSGSGDIDIQVKIESQTAIDPWAKAGIMIRDGLGNNARHASILITPQKGTSNNGVRLFWRESTPGGTQLLPTGNSFPFSAPYFLRLVKSGTTFTASARNPSSSSWTTIATRTISGFPSTYYYGLAQASHDPTMATSTFSSFTATSPNTSGLVSGNYYRITNVHSGKALEISGSSLSDGGNAVQRDYLGGNNQRWQLVDAGQGYWRLVNQNSGKVLDVSGGTSETGDGANVHQWTNFNATNQQWSITDLGGGIYRVNARHSGKALDVSGASTANGANVHQWTFGNGNNQKWRFQAP